jgi:hypothetical protein
MTNSSINGGYPLSPGRALASNQFTEDEALVDMLKTFAESRLDFAEDLKAFGQSVVGEHCSSTSCVRSSSLP